MKSRTAKWTVPATLTLAGLACYSIPGMAKTRDKSAAALYKAGETAEAKDDYITAYEDYYQAFQKQPKNTDYKISYQRLQLQAAAVCVKAGEKYRDSGDMTDALTQFMRALEIDPSYELAQQDIDAIHRKMDGVGPTPKGETSLERPNPSGDAMDGPVSLKPVSNEPLTLHVVSDAKEVYQTVGKIAGINVLFDPDWTSKRITVDLQNVELSDALRIVGLDSNTFYRVVTPNTIFVAQNTRAKRTELEEQAVQTFYLANAAQQNDLNDVQTALRNLFTGGAKLYAVPSQNAIVMRGTPDELLLAQRIIDDLDKARPEVVVDVSVLEVNRQKERNIGISLPQSFGLTLQANTATTAATTTTSTTGTDTSSTSTTNGVTLNQLGSLNATNFGVTVGQATANLLLSDTDTKVLQNPRIRATDGQKADLKVGEKIPVATGSYQTGAATAVVSSLVNTQFQYLDVGVEIEITPTVHYDHDVTLKMKIVVSQEDGASTISGVTEPIISQRTLDGTIRLKEGEVNIISGILTQQVSNSTSGTPGLGEIPLLKYLFSSTDRTVSKDEIVIMLTPHVVRGTQLTPDNLQQIDTGTTQNVEVRRIATIPIKVPAAVADKLVPAAASVQSGSQIPTAQTPGAAPAQTPPPPSKFPFPASGTMPPNPVPATAPNATTLAGGPVSLQLVPPAAPPKVGVPFQVAVNLAGGQDVYSVPMQVTYDASKLSFINADSGTFLSKDGQVLAMAHRDDGGNVVLSLSRPPGVAGISGSGNLVMLTFQAKAAGDSIVSIAKASPKNSQQAALPAITSGTIVHVVN